MESIREIKENTKSSIEEINRAAGVCNDVFFKAIYKEQMDQIGSPQANEVTPMHYTPSPSPVRKHSDYLDESMHFQSNESFDLSKVRSVVFIWTAFFTTKAFQLTTTDCSAVAKALNIMF
jgi:hypothetical protein